MSGLGICRAANAIRVNLSETDCWLLCHLFAHPRETTGLVQVDVVVPYRPELYAICYVRLEI